MSDLEAFFSEFRQEVLAGAAANKDFGLSEFLELFERELVGANSIEGIDFCHYRNAGIGVRVDGFWMNDDAGLDLFIADFDNRTTLETLTATDVSTFFRRISKFYTQCMKEPLYRDFDETCPVYGLARSIFENRESFGRVNLYLLSERRLSDQFKKHEIADHIGDMPIAFHIWDVSRLQRLRASKGGKERISIDIVEIWGQGGVARSSRGDTVSSDATSCRPDSVRRQPPNSRETSPSLKMLSGPDFLPRSRSLRLQSAPLSRRMSALIELMVAKPSQ